MNFKEAQVIRDKYFRKHIADNLEGKKYLIADVYVVPNEEILREKFIQFTQSDNIIGDASEMGIWPDDRAYGAMGLGKWDDAYTILLSVFLPEEQKTELMLAKDYPNIRDVVSEDILNKL